MQVLEFPHLCENEDLRLKVMRLNLCPTCRVMDRAACERCYGKLASLFIIIHSVPIFFGEGQDLSDLYEDAEDDE